MKVLDDLEHHVNGMSSLLKDREEGLASWWVLLGEHWKSVYEMWSRHIEEEKKYEEGAANNE